MKYNLTALMKYLKDEFGAIHERLDGMQQSYSDLQSSVDRIVVNGEKTGKEIKVINYRTERIEKWIIKAAEKSKIPYER
jgi:hypothetical protein